MLECSILRLYLCIYWSRFRNVQKLYQQPFWKVTLSCCIGLAVCPMGPIGIYINLSVCKLNMYLCLLQVRTDWTKITQFTDKCQFKDSHNIEHIFSISYCSNSKSSILLSFILHMYVNKLAGLSLIVSWSTHIFTRVF